MAEEALVIAFRDWKVLRKGSIEKMASETMGSNQNFQRKGKNKEHRVEEGRGTFLARRRRDSEKWAIAAKARKRNGEDRCSKHPDHPASMGPGTLP